MIAKLSGELGRARNKFSAINRVWARLLATVSPEIQARESELFEQSRRATGDELDAIEAERQDLNERKLEP